MIRNLALPIGIIAFLLIVSVGVISSGYAPSLLTVVILGSIIFLIAFLKPDFALLLLIFSMLLSPEFSLGAIGKREVVLRLDDILILVIGFGWLARMAVNKELGLLKVTPLNQPIIAYITICIIATLVGVLKGYAKLNISIFYVLKYFEYFLLYFVAVNTLGSMQRAKLFVYSLIVVCGMISIYGCILHFQGIERVTAPFEGNVGEANTLGGYLVFIICLVVGLLLNTPFRREKVLLSAVLCVAFPALLFTLSRGSWVAFVPAMLTLFFMTRRGKIFFLLVTFFVVLVSPVIIPKFFYKRIDYTFSEGRKYSLLGKSFKLEESASTRIEIMKYALRKGVKEPLMGYGIGSSLSIIDNQYARLIIEVGLLGVLAFIWLILAITINAFRILKKLRDDTFASGVTAGFIAGFIGLLVHAIGAESFILIRIMEPFWFVVAIIISLPELSTGTGGSEQKALGL